MYIYVYVISNSVPNVIRLIVLVSSLLLLLHLVNVGRDVFFALKISYR